MGTYNICFHGGIEKNIICILPLIWGYDIYYRKYSDKGAWVNTIDPDQTAPYGVDPYQKYFISGFISLHGLTFCQM